MHPGEWARLARLVAGEGTPTELAEIEAWARADADRSKALTAVLSAWELGTDNTAPPDKAKAWESIVRRKAARSRESDLVGLPADRRLPHSVTPRRLYMSTTAHRTRKIAWFAAAACLLIATAFAGSRLMRGTDRKVAKTVIPAREFFTSRGQRAEVRLTDGTKVILAAQSRLSVPAEYDSIGRVVTLAGEAYFDVVHNTARPFIVRAGKASVRDVGTRFAVRAYSDRTDLRVLVTNGEVVLEPQIGSPSGTRSLTRGQAARVRANGTVQVASNVDTAGFLAWTSGELVFNRTPASEAALEISRWYDVDISLDPALSRRTLTTVLHDQSISEVIQLVALSLDARVVRTGSKVQLTPNQRNRIE